MRVVVVRSRDFTLVHENCSSVKNTGDRDSCRKEPRFCAWMQVKKWRAPSISLQNWHSAVDASLNFCNCSECGSKSLQSLKSVDFWLGESPPLFRLILLWDQLHPSKVSSDGDGRREA